MSRILFAITLTLLCILLIGVFVFAPGVSSGWRLDLFAFVAALLLGILYVRTTVVAESDRRNNESLALRLENANIKLTQLDTLKSEFLSFASHQIKAPMTVVKGYAQLVLDGSFGSVSDQLKDIIEKIRVSSDRMIGLVDTFLNLRRIDEGRIEYHMMPLELNNLVAAIVDELQQLADTKHIRLSLEAPAHGWRVNADSQYLRQVLQNLVENAIKYTDKGSVTVSIVDGTKPGTVHLQVSDTGRGISHDLAPKLFEQFSRDQSISKEIAGTGLGLYIARKMVEAHSGRIWATSPGPGKGSVFSVELPSI
jgi:signal transduction histidine kinase